MPTARDRAALGLAVAFLDGDWAPPAMAKRGWAVAGHRRRWILELAHAARHAYPDPPRHAPRALARFLAACPPLVDAFERAYDAGDPLPIARRLPGPAIAATTTVMGPARWPVAHLDTVADLRDLLALHSTQLRWFADTASLERLVDVEQLRHYRYTWIPKRGVGARLIEAPKPVLRHLQRVILREVLAPVPPHPAAHGFVPGRSARSYAAGHVGRAVLIHLDLADFFPSISAGRIFGILQSFGYPELVAHLLTGLVTNTVPRRVWRSAPHPAGWADAHRQLGQHLARPHLPQGAPTSPALANLAAFHLDRRLAGFAAAASRAVASHAGASRSGAAIQSDGASQAGLTYSRYADDLALSSDVPLSRPQIERIIDLVRRIVRDEGFRLNERKIVVRRAGQHQRLAGLVVNATPNVDQRAYDQLKATLTNAARHGPASQNRAGVADFRAHLLGRISWVTHANPQRGAKLRLLFDRVDWAGPTAAGDPEDA